MARVRLFFANRRVDQRRVDDLQRTLREALKNLPFTDASQDVPRIDEWKVQASQVIAGCDAFICVVGTTTHLSEPVDWEIREAARHNIPILVTKLTTNSEVPAACNDLDLNATAWSTRKVAGKIGRLVLRRFLFDGDPPPHSDAIMKQYSLMVTSWEDLLSRRQNVNTLYVTALTALLAGMGVLMSFAEKAGVITAGAGVLLLALIGMSLSINWRRTVESYGVLSAAKSDVVTALETYLPAKIFDAEWRVLQATKYRSTTETDRQSALFFCALFVLAGVVSGAVIIIYSVRS